MADRGHIVAAKRQRLFDSRLQTRPAFVASKLQQLDRLPPALLLAMTHVRRCT
jgi:hypothetical protein